MYTRIYFDCVNQESWLDIHVHMLYHKNCFKIVRASRAIPGLSRKKIKTKTSFLESFNLSKLSEGLTVEVFRLEMLVNELQKC